MVPTPDTKTLAIGISLIVLGALMLLGRFGVGDILPFLGIVLIVAGILLLIKVVPGGLLVGVVLLVLGLLLQFNWVDLPKGFGQVLDLVNLVAGIILIVLGALKLMGR